MAVKEKNKSKIIGAKLKEILSRNQRWLANKIQMREALLSEKITGQKEFTQEELDLINKELNTDFRL